jgi:hypothetical protein
MAISSMSVATKEIEEINRKFGDRIVSGDSVRKFNDLIGILVGELKFMAGKKLTQFSFYYCFRRPRTDGEKPRRAYGANEFESLGSFRH